jgi:hypothetical protein
MSRPITIATVFAGIFIAAAAATAQDLAAQSKTHLGAKPSSILTFWANVPVGTNQALQLVGRDGSLVDGFVLPPKTLLVVTDLVVSPNIAPISGLTRGGLINNALTGASNPYFSFDATKVPNQTIHLTSGAVWSEIPRVVNASDSVNAVFVQVYGYLVKDK